MVSSRFLRFFFLAILLVVVPSFVYLSQRQNGFVRDPETGEWFSEDSYKHGNKPAQLEQGHGPLVSNMFKGFSNLWNLGHDASTTTLSSPFTSLNVPAPTAPPVEEPEVEGAYAHQMTNVTAKYVAS